MINDGKHQREQQEILVVDDTPESLQLLCDILGSRGCRVRSASSGRLALRSVAADMPDLILLDVKMPDMDGYEICRRLKADEASREIPVIFISALGATSEKIKGFDAGGVDYITKPFQVEEVVARVKTHLELRRLQLQMKQAYDKVEIEVRQRTAELSQANKKLLESERKFKTIFENIQDAYIMADMDGTILLVNPACARILGYENAQELIGRNMAAHVYAHTSEREKVKSSLLQKDRLDDCDLEFRRKDGNHIIVSCNVHLVHDTNGTPVAIEGLFRDVTERRRDEGELRQSQSLLQSLFNAIPGLINILDKDLNIIYSNWHGHEYVTEKERASNPKCYKVFLRKDEPCPDCHVQGVYETSKPCTVEVFNTVHGTYKEVRTFPVFDEAGKVLYVVEHAIDINERKQAEIALRTEKEKLETVTRNIGAGLNIISKEYRILWANQIFKQEFGDIEGEICYQALHELHHVCSDCGVKEVFATGKGPVIHQKKAIDVHGNEVWSEIIVTPLKDEEGNVSAALEVVIPITERKKAEQERKEIEKQLRQAQKMESLGTLAGGVAHDFNNILTAILISADMVLEGLEPNSESCKLQKEVINAGRRARELVKQILAFSRQVEHTFNPLLLQVIIKETLKLLQSSIPTTIEIRQDIDSSCKAVLADPTLIHQVMMNLCVNSYYAMREKGGVLEVCLRQVEIGRDEYIADLELQPGTYIRLSVSDTGSGIKPQEVEKIFEPYFTTKPVNEGTGLGLSVVHGIVKSHNGHITVYSEPGKGTVFNLYFPCCETSGAVEKEKREDVPATGNERILIVDDEEYLLKTEKLLLEKLGYRLTATTNSLEALRIFEQNPDDFDLVVTDMTMPKMTGVELSKKLLAIRPDLPIVLLTGFNALITKETALDIGIRQFGLKPFNKNELVHLVRKALE